MRAPNGMWECPDCGAFIPKTQRTCQKCAAVASSEVHPHRSKQYDNTNYPNKQKTIAYETKPIYPSYSRAAKTLHILSDILWVIGPVLAILTLFTEMKFAYPNAITAFHWIACFRTVFSYGVGGILARCAAELCENIESIATYLRGMTISPQKFK